MDIKAVVFDLDGTLAHTLPDIKMALLKSTGLDIDEKVIFDAIGHGMKVMLTQVFAHYDYIPEDFDATMKHYSEVYAEGSGKNATLNPGAKELLEWLGANGIHTALATMKPKGATMTFLERMDMLKYFEIIITGDDMVRPKPDGWCVEEVCRRYGIDVNQAMMVGDGMTDVGAGKNAGAYAAALLGGYYDQEVIKSSNADFLLTRLDELIDIIGA